MESTCEYVNSRGILLSCKIHTAVPLSSNPSIDKKLFTGLSDGDSVYVCSDAIPNFISYILPTLNKRIVLVSGDGDYTFASPESYRAILESQYILKWFCQNSLIIHPKVIHLPIGTYYHSYFDVINGQSVWHLKSSPLEQESEINRIILNAVHFSKRQPKCYTTFHFQLNRGDRVEAYNSIPKNLVYYEPTPVSREQSHRNQTEYAFVVSPYGGGPDCHRTWEALMLGCIPVVKSSNLDPLFEDLPVLLVRQWSDVTQELLDKTIVYFTSRTFNYNKLRLQYWVDRINNASNM